MKNNYGGLADSSVMQKKFTPIWEIPKDIFISCFCLLEQKLSYIK